MGGVLFNDIEVNRKDISEELRQLHSAIPSSSYEKLDLLSKKTKNSLNKTVILLINKAYFNEQI